MDTWEFYGILADHAKVRKKLAQKLKSSSQHTAMLDAAARLQNVSQLLWRCWMMHSPCSCCFAGSSCSHCSAHQQLPKIIVVTSHNYSTPCPPPPATGLKGDGSTTSICSGALKKRKASKLTKESFEMQQSTTLRLCGIFDAPGKSKFHGIRVKRNTSKKKESMSRKSGLGPSWSLGLCDALWHGWHDARVAGPGFELSRRADCSLKLALQWLALCLQCYSLREQVFSSVPSFQSFEGSAGRSWGRHRQASEVASFL